MGAKSSREEQPPAAAPAAAGAPPVGMNRRRRVSVSAEVDKVETPMKKKFVVKDAETVAEIEVAVKGNFLFSSLPPEQLEEVVGAMESKEFADGSCIIKEGDDGDFFYVIASGVCSVFIGGKNDDKEVRRLKAGDSFGELALMYNAPRSATIKAAGPVKCWALDRITFRNTILASGQARRKMYEEFLAQVDLLKGLTKGELAPLADAVEPLNFEDGQVVIQEGDKDRANFKFYFVESGEAQAFINKDGDAILMSTLGEGDYFGEKALVEKTPRTATVKAAGPLKCAALSIAAFERLMGPCEDLLKERASTAYPRVEDVKSGRVSPKGPGSPSTGGPN